LREFRAGAPAPLAGGATLRRPNQADNEPVHIALRSSSSGLCRFEQKAIAAGLLFRRNRNTRPLQWGILSATLTIDTPFLRSGHLKKEWEMHLAGIKRRVPMGRLGTPDEVAAALDFLISECSSYITGPMIHPNGGHLVL
jgi:Enoyl-(Acyl carrier protein) reductase